MEVLIAFFAATFGWLVVIYNRLVRGRNRVLAAWSDIDVQLKRRHDLLPKLVQAVQQYAAYEQAALDAVVQARTEPLANFSASQRGDIEAALGNNVHRLLALVENHPELKANQNFVYLQNEISSVEKDIQHARRYYNGAVRYFNTRIESFPDLVVAKTFRYLPFEYFDFVESASVG